MWGEQPNADVLQKTLGEEIPLVLDYLEAQLPADGFLFGDLSIADVALGCFFRSAVFARFRVDVARWPITAGFVGRVLAVESFRKLAPFEERLMRVPIAEHRSVLAELGAPLTRESWGTTVPRRGVMRL